MPTRGKKRHPTLRSMIGRLGKVATLREQLAVQCAHTRRLVAEKETLLERIRQLESERQSRFGPL